jgi:tRNA threonylcarbamoyladenosine biosynthesis protein TsaE
MTQNIIRIFEAHSVADYKKIAAEILQSWPDLKIFYLHGQLGAGKTSLVKELAAHLGYIGTVQSPTYAIINIYNTGQEDIYHMDLYRLERQEELLETCAEEYIHSGQYCFVEWSELLESVSDWPFCRIEISVMPDGMRKITAEMYS